MSEREPITCREVVERVSAYLGDDLDAEARITLEQHLLVCPPCATHIDQMRTTLTLVKTLRTDVPALAAPAAMDVFRKWKAGAK